MKTDSDAFDSDSSDELGREKMEAEDGDSSGVQMRELAAESAAAAETAGCVVVNHHPGVVPFDEATDTLKPSRQLRVKLFGAKAVENEIAQITGAGT